MTSALALLNSMNAMEQLLMASPPMYPLLFSGAGIRQPERVHQDNSCYMPWALERFSVLDSYSSPVYMEYPWTVPRTSRFHEGSFERALNRDMSLLRDVLARMDVLAQSRASGSDTQQDHQQQWQPEHEKESSHLGEKQKNTLKSSQRTTSPHTLTDSQDTAASRNRQASCHLDTSVDQTRRQKDLNDLSASTWTYYEMVESDGRRSLHTTFEDLNGEAILTEEKSVLQSGDDGKPDRLLKSCRQGHRANGNQKLTFGPSAVKGLNTIAEFEEAWNNAVGSVNSALPDSSANPRGMTRQSTKGERGEAPADDQSDQGVSIHATPAATPSTLNLPSEEQEHEILHWAQDAGEGAKSALEATTDGTNTEDTNPHPGLWMGDVIEASEKNTSSVKEELSEDNAAAEVAIEEI